jgi:hypothetical protein
MDARVEQLVTQAMALPGESRALLAELLVESLEADDIGPIERAWITEAKRRREEIRSGLVEPIEGEAALKQVRDSLT